MASFPKSKIWDKTTQRSIDAVRAFIHRHPQPTISHIQNESVHERPLKGPFHLLPDILPAPIEDDIRQALFRTINGLGEIEYERPALAPVPVEWISKKACGLGDRSAPSADKRSDLARLAMDCANDLIILHVHGGAFFQGSPRSYRPTTSKLASLSGGRVVSIEYRLSPQNVFPAAILDVLVAYLSLLYPSPSSAHGPVDPSRIVFAGDSAGGVLLFCVLQFLLQTVSHAPILFHSRTVSFPIQAPSGIAVLSLPGDLSQSLPSYEVNRVNDLFLEVPWYHPDYPSCPIWPANPPRPDIYCPMSSFLHPLVTLALAKFWAGTPPIWLASGEELFADGAKAVARRAALQDVNVTWTQFEAMPHCFPTVPGLIHSRQARVLMEKWANFCRECVDGELIGRQRVKASKVGFKDAREQPMDLENPGDPSFKDIERMIEAKVRLVDKVFKQELCRGVQSKL
ncbi:MAG: hypothetical protein Q9164_004917 [Protoblastenia rupestris]